MLPFLAAPAPEPSSIGAASLARRSVVEGLGTALLLSAVVGSGIMGERLAGGSAALALLANSLATGAGLSALILAFGSISGAQFNPLVTLADAWLGRRPWRDVPAYAFAQTIGALAGVAAAEAMFQTPVLAFSEKARSGLPQVFAEAVATLGLLLVIFGSSRRGLEAVAAGAGTYIAAAYWFTSSTSFANPAVTIARSMTNTFAGIRPSDVPGFLAGQLCGTAAFVWLWRWLEASAGSSPARGRVGSS